MYSKAAREEIKEEWAKAVIITILLAKVTL